MGKKSRRKSKMDYVVRDVSVNPSLVEKIDETKPGWRKHTKKLLAEQYNSKVDLSKPVMGINETKKMIKKMTKEAIQKRIAEIKAKQEADKLTSPTNVTVVENIPTTNITDAVVEEKSPLE